MVSWEINMGAQLSKLVSTAGVASWWVIAATHAHAGGFAIAPQSASALGNVVASAAATEDASTVWMNPAGMPLLPGAVNFTAVATAAFGSHRFRDGGSTGLFANPGSGDGGDAGTNEVIPSFYVTSRLPVASGHITAGLGVNVPFGLTTEYDPGWRGSPIAIKSSAESVNINPAVAAQISDGLFVGVGLNLQRFSTELTNLSRHSRNQTG
jgi:long-chain fatty acid transport protein